MKLLMFSATFYLILKQVLLKNPPNGEIQSTDPANSEKQSADPCHEKLKYPDQDWTEICQKGTQQSPIDFNLNKNEYTILSSTEIVKNTYNEVTNGKFESLIEDGKFRVSMSNLGDLYFKKNGVNYTYNLNEIHFHIGSEHTFDGTQHAMEMHLVHKKDYTNFGNDNEGKTKENDPDKRNEYLVIGILFYKNETRNNSFLDNITWELNGIAKTLSLKEFAREDKSFYHYEGSLTTPNCTENVNWVVMTQLEPITSAQLATINSIFSKNCFEKGNSRKPKSLNGRQIFYFDPKSNDLNKNHLNSNKLKRKAKRI